LFGVGNNDWGCIGDGTDDNCETIKQIKYFSKFFIIDVIGCEFHCLAISNRGVIFAWGDNEFGQLGNGNDNDEQLTPIKIFKI
jgi:alpha-tubulin suppressor-like RCC1 family protein